MKLVKNLFNINIRILLRYINYGYRFYNQKIDFEKTLNQNYKPKSNFCFLQVGANDGVSFDNLFEFVQKRNTRGIVIEPIKDYYNELVENYKYLNQIIPVNKAIHSFENEMTIFKIGNEFVHLYEDWVKGMASFNPNHYKNLNIEPNHIINERVDCDTLMNIIEENNIFNFNYFQIDTEGYDYEVLKMINFNKTKPEIIKFEAINLDEQDLQNAIKMLRAENYYVIRIGIDMIGYNLSKVKLYWL